ncbi:MAG: M15 family metallopeptidase, partial [Comamonas sp.]
MPLASLAPGVKQDMRYATRHNFMGKPVAGYEAGVCWLSRAAAQSLAAVQKELAEQGLSLKVYDCYRPQTAVNDFVRWGKDMGDQKNKDMYYPRVPKSELFKRG